MSIESAVTTNQPFRILEGDEAITVASQAYEIDWELRKKWASDNFPATFGARRDDANYFRKGSGSLLDAINNDSGAAYFRLWAAETMVRCLTHLSETDYEPVDHDGFKKRSYLRDIMHTNESLSVKKVTSQLTYVDQAFGRNWLFNEAERYTYRAKDYYGIINQLPPIFDEHQKSQIRFNSCIYAEGDFFSEDMASPLTLGGMVVEMADVVCQFSYFDPAEVQPFKAPGVEADKPRLSIMPNPHFMRAWRTQL